MDQSFVDGSSFELHGDTGRRRRRRGQGDAAAALALLERVGADALLQFECDVIRRRIAQYGQGVFVDNVAEGYRYVDDFIACQMKFICYY